MAQQLWATDSLGGTLTLGKLSKELRKQNGPQYVFRQFVDMKEGVGLRGGDTLTFKKQLRIDSRGTKLTESNTIPSNLIKFIGGSGTVSEWGNKVEYTGKLETLAEWNVGDKFQQGLRQDILDTYDNQVATIYKTAEFVAVCSTTALTVFTTNGTATVTAQNNPALGNIRDIVDYMELKHIPKYGGGKEFIGILSINAMSSVVNELEGLAKYTTPVSQFNEETGRYYKCRFIADNEYLSNVIGTNSELGEGIFFGDEAVCEILAKVEDVVMASDPKELGRTLYVGWWGIVDWIKYWSLSTDDLNSTGKGIERIVRLYSA